MSGWELDAMLERATDVPAGVPLWQLFHVNAEIGDRLEAMRPTAKPPPPPVHAYKQYATYRSRALVLDAQPRVSESSLTDAVASRRSTVAFGGGSVHSADLDALVMQATGPTGALQSRAGHIHLRAIPSAGALYPIEVYVDVISVAGERPGAYHFNRIDGEVSCVAEHDGDDVLQRLLGPSDLVGSAAAAILLTAQFERTTAKYGERGYRYALLEAGHAAQNFALLAPTFGMAVALRGAFFDAAANGLLGVDGISEAVLYVILVGTPPSEPAPDQPRGSRSTV